jgi:hypothetical protein
MQEPDAEARFQLIHISGDCGLGTSEHIGSVDEAPGIDHRGEGLHF